jgi:hypothetical protein
MLVCVSLSNLARETAGAARTRSSLRPLISGRRFLAKLGRNAPRECRGVFVILLCVAIGVILRRNIIKSDVALWARVVRDAGISAD